MAPLFKFLPTHISATQKAAKSGVLFPHTRLSSLCCSYKRTFPFTKTLREAWCSLLPTGNPRKTSDSYCIILNLSEWQHKGVELHLQITGCVHTWSLTASYSKGIQQNYCGDYILCSLNILTSRCSSRLIVSSFFFKSSLSCVISLNKSSVWHIKHKRKLISIFLLSEMFT